MPISGEMPSVSLLLAGFEPEELFGPYIAEDRGKTVWLFPGLKELRYLIPFRRVEESIEFFRKAAEIRPGGVAFFGDDMEKFGVWPGTHKHCYMDGWLKSFFVALEANSSWLKTSTPSAPWTLVEANDKYFSRIKVLQIVAEKLRRALD